MAAPGFRAVGTFASGSSSCVPGLPSGWAENDILVIIAEADEEATINTPSGYAFAVSGITGSGTTGVKLQVMAKRATSSESAPTVDGPSDHVHAVIAAITGVNTSGAVTSSGVMTIGAATGNPAATAVTLTIPAITTTVADALVALCTSSTFNGNSTTLWSSWTNANLTSLTERQDQAETTGRGGGTGLATGTRAATADIGTSTVTHTSAVPVVGVAIAFYPSTSSIVTFEATIAGTGALTVDAVRDKRVFEATIAGLGVLTVGVSLEKTFAVAIDGTSVVTVDAAVQQALEVAIAGLGTLAVEFANVKILEVSVVGSSTVTADFVNQVGFDTIVSGVGAVVADVVRQVDLGAVISGSGVVTAETVRQLGLEASISGVGAVTADTVRQPRVFDVAVAGTGVLAIDVAVSSGTEELTIRTVVGVGL